MRKRLTEMTIVKTLKESRGNFVSGELLAENAFVSRAAIWKQIKRLREKGYEIEALPKSGYRLISLPDTLLPEEIVPILRTRSFGQEIVYRRIIDSTNELAKEVAEGEAVEGTIVIAEEQKRGKGRLNRVWCSPAGGIWLSIILRPHVLPVEASRFTLLAAVAIAKAIENLGIKPEIKWPNDILIDGKKVCGILLELSAELDRINYLVAGFGINANFACDKIPEESRDRATTLYEVLGREIDRPQFISDFLFEFENGYQILLSGGWEEILNDWNNRCKMLNQNICLNTLHGTVEGKFAGVDEFGAIKIETSQGCVKTFAAGDVTVYKRSV